MLTHGSLFAGIGGFDLGFERAGIETDWQIEIEDYCRKVLAQHFPGARQYADIRNCCGIYKPNERRMRSGKTRHRCQRAHHLKWVDIISGGFPCQDISNAGKRAGIEGDRSGLWSEMFRIVCELRPRYVVVENVSALLGRGMGRVLGDLAESGYDAEWDCLPAAAFGAPHIRDRVWLLAYPRQEPRFTEGRTDRGNGCAYVLPQGNVGTEAERSEHRELVALVPGIHPRMAADWWAHQFSVARTVDGLSRQLVDARNDALGEAVVPQIAEWIAQRIIACQ